MTLGGLLKCSIRRLVVDTTTTDGHRNVTDVWWPVRWSRMSSLRWPRSVVRRRAVGTVSAATAVGRPRRPSACDGRGRAWPGGRTARTACRTRRTRTAWRQSATDSAGTVRRIERNAKCSPATCTRTASRPNASSCGPVDKKKQLL